MDLLTAAYDEKEGVFYTLLNPYTKEEKLRGVGWLSPTLLISGTLQLETRYLSDITGDPKYAEMGDAFYQILKREGSYKKTGLFPVHFDAGRGNGKREEDEYLRDLYDDAVRGMEEHLLYFSIPDDLYFLQELKVPSFSAVQRMDHLLCFRAGALSARNAIGNGG
ncbi:hypothetical protein PF003_g25516 [Phytophthora fragariae]|nr:hypothetical protein PF003_g25516 [Phytophthora fragariae]